LFTVEWEGEHSPDEKPVGGHFMFEWVIRKEIDGSVGHGGFAEDTYAKAGGFSGY
jgi:hypothetical protein